MNPIAQGAPGGPLEGGPRANMAGCMAEMYEALYTLAERDWTERFLILGSPTPLPTVGSQVIFRIGPAVDMDLEDGVLGRVQDLGLKINANMGNLYLLDAAYYFKICERSRIGVATSQWSSAHKINEPMDPAVTPIRGDDDFTQSALLDWIDDVLEAGYCAKKTIYPEELQ